MKKPSLPFPKGRTDDFDEIGAIRLYVQMDGLHVHCTAWDTDIRFAIHRDTVYAGGWCTCNTYFYLEVFLMKFLKAAMAKQKTIKKGQEASDRVLEKRCPALHEFLTVTAVEGKPRVPSSMAIFTDGGAWKASLADKEGECSLYVTAETVEGLWDAMEEAIQGPNPDWRAWKAMKAQKGKK